MHNKPVSAKRAELKIALQWFIALESDSCTQQQRDEFEIWLKQHPQNPIHYQEAQQLWSRLDEVKTKAIADHNSAPNNRRHKQRSKSTTALSALLLAGLGLAWQDYQSSTDYIATGIGEQKQITLADQSIITLNANTRISTHISWLRRQVDLLEGEAQFQVSHQNFRPFTVNTGPLNIKDIGTIFTIRNRPESRSVVVMEGEVAIHQPGHWFGTALKAGFARRFTQSGELLAIETADPHKANAWLTGKLVFNHTPLAEVSAELERHHPIHFVFLDKNLAQQTITGNFDSRDLNSFLQAISQIYPINIQHKKQQIELSRAH